MAEIQRSILGRLFGRTVVAERVTAGAAARLEPGFSRELQPSATRSAWKRSSAPAAAGGFGTVQGAAGGFEMGLPNRLFASWGSFGRTTDVYLKSQLRTMQYRSADLARNDDYIRHFLALARSNVIGPDGVGMQSRVKKRRGGDLDTETNTALQDAWQDWGKLGSPTVCGRLSWLDVENLFVTCLARDGEVFIREHKATPAAANPYGYALELLSPALFDPAYQRRVNESTWIELAIERNLYKRPLAYWARTANPDGEQFPYSGVRYDRIPAADLLHIFVIEDPEQSRGIPWISTAALRLKMLGGYEMAELVASRLAASKTAQYKRTQGGLGDAPATGKDEETGAFVDDIEAGTIGITPPGWELSPIDWQHPNSSYAAFIKGALRGVGSGLNTAYHSLANDLEGVNFSSIRSGTIEERDLWGAVQLFTIRHLHAVVYERWLRTGIAVQASKLAKFSLDDLERLNAAWWRPRGWQWVDPRNDADAAGKRLAMGLTSRTKLAAEAGEEFLENLREQAEEKRLAAEYGIELVDIVAPSKAKEVSDAAGTQDEAAASSDAGDGEGGGKTKGAKA